MKRAANILILSITLSLFFSLAVAYAGDVVLEATVKSKVLALDKNGNKYVRLVIAETRNLNGVTYKAEVAVMAFGDMVAKAEVLEAGQKLEAICNGREYNGKLSYTILSFVN